MYVGANMGVIICSFKLYTQRSWYTKLCHLAVVFHAACCVFTLQCSCIVVYKSKTSEYYKCWIRITLLYSKGKLRTQVLEFWTIIRESLIIYSVGIRHIKRIKTSILDDAKLYRRASPQGPTSYMYVLIFDVVISVFSSVGALDFLV